MKYVTAAFIFHKGKLLTVFHKKLNIWLHVGGHVEENETFEDALIREVKEEVNLSVKICTPYFSQKTKYKVNFKAQPLYIHYGEENGLKKTWLDFLCTTNDISSLKIKKDELKTHKWVSLAEFKELRTFPLVRKLGVLAFDILKSKNTKSILNSFYGAAIDFPDVTKKRYFRPRNKKMFKI